MTPASHSTASTALTPHPPQPGPSPVRGGDRDRLIPVTVHAMRCSLRLRRILEARLNPTGNCLRRPSRGQRGLRIHPSSRQQLRRRGRYPRQTSTSRANAELARTRDITAATFDPQGSCHGQVRTVMRLRVRVLRLRWAGAAPPATITRSLQRAQQQPRPPTQQMYAAFVWGTPAKHQCAFPPLTMSCVWVAMRGQVYGRWVAFSTVPCAGWDRPYLP